MICANSLQIVLGFLDIDELLPKATVCKQWKTVINAQISELLKRYSNYLRIAPELLPVRSELLIAALKSSKSQISDMHITTTSQSFAANRVLSRLQSRTGSGAVLLVCDLSDAESRRKTLFLTRCLHKGAWKDQSVYDSKGRARCAVLACEGSPRTFSEFARNLGRISCFQADGISLGLAQQFLSFWKRKLL
jgi:hypothetical protein